MVIFGGLLGRPQIFLYGLMVCLCSFLMVFEEKKSA